MIDRCDQHAVGKDTTCHRTTPSPTSRPLRRAGSTDAPSAIDALPADTKAAGTPIDGVDGLLNQITKAALERALQTEVDPPSRLSPRRSRRQRNRQFAKRFVIVLSGT